METDALLCFSALSFLLVNALGKWRSNLASDQKFQTDLVPKTCVIMMTKFGLLLCAIVLRLPQFLPPCTIHLDFCNAFWILAINPVSNCMPQTVNYFS